MNEKHTNFSFVPVKLESGIPQVQVGRRIHSVTEIKAKNAESIFLFFSLSFFMFFDWESVHKKTTIVSGTRGPSLGIGNIPNSQLYIGSLGLTKILSSHQCRDFETRNIPNSLYILYIHDHELSILSILVIDAID